MFACSGYTVPDEWFGYRKRYTNHVWRVVLVLMLVRSLIGWSRLWSTHEMHATELSDEVESEVQASALSVSLDARVIVKRLLGHNYLLSYRCIHELYSNW